MYEHLMLVSLNEASNDSCDQSQYKTVQKQDGLEKKRLITKFSFLFREIKKSPKKRQISESKSSKKVT